MSHLQTENLTYIYGAGTPFKITALDNININIEKGDFVAIIGHTGSGKSTLVQHLNGLLKPTDGKIFLDGENPVGFLDLGQAGIADRWQDIYWCVWSMHYNFCEFFGMAEDAYARWQSLLFDELGIPYDAEKLRWYQTLEDLWEMTE